MLDTYISGDCALIVRSMAQPAVAGEHRRIWGSMAQPATSDYFDVIQILRSVRLRAIVEVALCQVGDICL